MKIDITTVEELGKYTNIHPILTNPVAIVQTRSVILQGPITMEGDTMKLTYTPAPFMGFQSEPRVISIFAFGNRLSMNNGDNTLPVSSVQVVESPAMEGGRKRKTVAKKPAAKAKKSTSKAK